MDAWINLARGPLFRVAFTVMVLGLLYRLGVAVAQVLLAWRRAGDRRLPLADIARATLGWLVPLRLVRMRPVYSAASFVLHLGVVAAPLFLLGHVALLAGVLPSWWPRLDPLLADSLTVAALVATAVLLVGRLAVKAARHLSRFGDVAVLVVLGLMLVLGFLAAHPTLSPLPARTALLCHILLGNLVLVLMPLSKIAHCVLYPVTQLIFQVGWHFPAESGRHVAIALAKENEPV